MIRKMINALRSFEDALKWEDEIQIKIMNYLGDRKWDNPEYVQLQKDIQEALDETAKADRECVSLGIKDDEDFMILWMK